MALPVGLRAFHHADFRRFFWAQLVAQTGTWMQTVAQSWLVLQLTPSPFKLGLIGSLQFAPILLFSIASGALADRVRKRRLLIGAQAALGGQALGLAALVASGHVQYWHVAVLAFCSGLVNVLDQPARQSLVAEMVGRADVASAVALNSASFNAARIVGPGLGGLLIASFGVVPAFVLNGLGFAVAVIMLLGLRTQGTPKARSGGGVLYDVSTGLRYAFSTREIRLTLGLLFIVSIFVFNFTVYVPLVVRTVLHLGAEGFGLLMACLGVGAVTGALAVGALGARRPPTAVLFAAAALACGALVALSTARSFWTAAALLFLTGLFGLVLVASCNTAMQLSAPDELRGRVMSLYTLIWGGVFPFGAFIVGSVSERWGVGRALLGNGAAGLLGIGLLLGWWTLRAAPSRRLSEGRAGTGRAPE
jgi:predicted MFS family arabinose efflux permease